MTLTANGSIILSADADDPVAMTGEVSDGTNKLELTAVTGQTSDGGTALTIAYGGKVQGYASGSSVELTAGTTVLSGALELKVDTKIDANAVLDQKTYGLTIDAGKTLTVAADGTLTASAAMTLNGNLVSNGTTNLTSTITVGTAGSINGTIISSSGQITLTSGGTTAQLKNVSVIDNATPTASTKYTNVKAGTSNLVVKEKDLNGIAAAVSGSSIEVVKGTITMTAGLTLGVDTKVDADATLAASSNSLTISGSTLTVYGTLTGSDITNNGKIVAANGGDITGAVFTASSTGTVTRTTDESDMDEVEIKGRIQGTGNNYSASQIVTISANSALAEGAELVVAGKLVIPEGVTLTIEKTAVLTLNGATLEIEGSLVIDELDSADATKGLIITLGYVTVSGSIVDNGNIDFKKGTMDIEADGTLTVGETGVMAVTANTAILTIEDSGTMIVNGDFSGVICNGGLVTYDSEVAATGDVGIRMMKSGATVDVVQFTAAGDNTPSSIKKLTVTDKYLVQSTYTDTTTRQTVNVTDTGKEDKVVIQPKYSTFEGIKADYLLTVSGIKLVSGVSTTTTSSLIEDSPTEGYNKVTDKQYTKNMAVSGSIEASVAYDESGTAAEKANATGSAIDISSAATNAANRASMKVNGELTIGDGIVLTNASYIGVTGTISTGSDEATLTNSGMIAVTSNGEVSLVKAELGGTVKATKYVTSAKDSTGTTVKTYHYVDINKALAVVSAEGSEVTELTLVGEQTISASAELPTGVTLDVGTKVLKVSKDNEEIIFSIAEGATVKGSTTIVVDDTLYAENKKDLKPSVSSDVKTEELDENGKAVKDGWVRYTNLAVALSEAESGDVIKITGSTISVSSNMTIADGVTVELPGTSTMTIADGVTLTIDRVLQADGSVKAKSAFDLTAAKVTSGDKKYSSAIVVSGKLMLKGTASYEDGKYTTSSGSGVELTAGAPIAGLYYSEGEYSVIAGIDTALEDISEIVGDITVNGKVSGGDYSVAATTGFYKIVVSDDTAKTGDKNEIDTVLSVKSLTLDGVTLDVDGYFTGSVVYADASIAATHAAGFELYTSSSKAYVKGAIDISDLGDSFSIAAGKVYTGEITLVDINTTAYKETALNVAAGAELIVDTTVSGVERMVVDGTLTVPYAKTITVDYLQVNGTVSVDAATASASAGTLKIADDGTLKVGTSSSSTGAGAVFNGPVTLVDSAVAFVYTGATVDSAFLASVEDCYTTAFYVDGSIWMTAYSDQKTAIGMQYPPKANVTAEGWASYEGGSDVGVYNTGSKITEYTIGEYASLYYLYETVIYDIMILADEGVDNVYLNGQAMAYGMYGSTTDGYAYGYYLKVAAGTYNVTYTLKNGYSGTATLALNGTEYSTASVSGASFTVSGDAGDVNLQLTGIEKSGYVDPVEPQKEDNSLKVTDYLLIVLVILVVVLAVIVALRLMRS